MKRSFFVLFLLLAFASAQMSAYDFMVDGICYTIIETDGVQSVAVDQKPSSLGNYSGSINIPSIINYEGVNYPVTRIDDFAFGDCENLVSVTIPNSVTTIGTEAFYNSGIKSIYIPESVIDLNFHDNVFVGAKLESIVVAPGNPVYDSRNNCNAIILTENKQLITGCINTNIPNDVLHIGWAAFAEIKELISIDLPESLRSIGNSAFSECSSLKSIHIPSRVSTIGDNCFSDCSNLESITVDASNSYYDSRYNCNAIIKSNENKLIVGCSTTIIPSSVIAIGKSAFKGSGLTAVSIPSTITEIGEDAFYACSNLRSVTIPNTISRIESWTFKDCISLLSCNIPESVTEIDLSAFQNCTSLRNITIPNSVISIGKNPFAGCTSLMSITVEDGNSKYHSYGNCNAIIEKATSTLISGCKTTIIPDSTLAIANSAFEGLSSLQSIIIPNGVTSIGRSAFDSSGLTDITIPSSVTTIKDYAFARCAELQSVHLADGLIALSGMAFYRCVKLPSIYIPESVTTIGDGCFQRCDNMISVSVGNPNPVLITQSTFSNRANAALYVPESSIATYQSADVWKEFKFINKLQDSSVFGDVNNDGIVNLDDCEAIANFLMGKTTESFNIHSADVNSDGRIDVADYTAISHLIQYGTIIKP